MRSRVMPGSLVTIERRVPVRRLKSVDFPTFGRPTITIDGNFSFVFSFMFSVIFSVIVLGNFPNHFRVGRRAPQCARQASRIARQRDILAAVRGRSGARRPAQARHTDKMTSSEKASATNPGTRPQTQRGSLLEVSVVFLKLGLLAYGGTAGLVAMMRREIVEKHQWTSEQEFLDL